jgi:quercetin dioxygenase-like cupin family protein
MPVIKPEIVKSEPVDQGQGITRKMLISPEIGPNFAMRQFSMQPGGFMPLHTNLVEHEQYILRGHAVLELGDETVAVQAGDAVFIPAGLPHSYTNTGEESFVFLCLVPNKEDRSELVEPGSTLEH